jgi:NADPH2:quinone reductase
LLKGCSIVGVWWGGFMRNEPEFSAACTAELMDWFREGRVKPHISARYPLARAAEALEQVAQRKVVGKVVLVP